MRLCDEDVTHLHRLRELWKTYSLLVVVIIVVVSINSMSTFPFASVTYLSYSR